MKFEAKHWMGIIAGVVMAAASGFFFAGQTLMYFLLVIALIIITLPFVMSILSGQQKQKEKEEKFLSFARDLVENVKSGTPISKSIVNLQNRNYGTLSSHVKKLSNQLTLGIPLAEALGVFAKETKSPVISRAVGLISEAQRAGGKIDTILESVAHSVNQTEDLKKERKAAVSNLVTQGYIIFMVFIVIMLVLEFKILPLVSDLATPEGVTIAVQSINAADFSMPLFIMLLVQSLFAGLVIGKISEGSIGSGIKHSFVLLVITLLVTTGSRALFGA